MFHVEHIFGVKSSLLYHASEIIIQTMKRPWIAAIIIATILIVFRIFTATNFEYANFAPVAALLFCGAAFWKSNKWMLPTAALVWLISWPLVSMLQGYSPFNAATLVTVVAFIAVIVLGLFFSGKSTLKLLFGTILGATAFYITTNTASFFGDPQYSKTLDGYIQCMWTGSPIAKIPTWAFFRNSLVGNIAGTSLFLSAMSIPAIQKATQFKFTRKHA